MIDKAKARRLARAIKPSVKYTDTPAKMNQGLVTATDIATGTCTVLIAGATTPVESLSVIGWLPGVGEVVWLLQKDATTVVLGTMLRDNWPGPWNASWGLVPDGFATAVSVSGVVADQVLTGLSIAFEAVANRNYRLRADVPAVVSTVGGDTAGLTLVDGSGVLPPSGRCLAGGSAQDGISIEWIKTYAVGLQTVSAHGQRVGGTGSLTYGAPMISVEDIGPSTTGP